MAAHKGPASLRPRFTRSGSSVAAIPVIYTLPAAYSQAKAYGCERGILVTWKHKGKFYENVASYFA
jgi:hypothetical protein